MNHRERDVLLQGLFEGSLGGEDLPRLQAELRSNPEAREAYREYLLLESSLRFRSKGVDLLRVLPMERMEERRRLRVMKRTLVAAAAVILLGALVFVLLRPKKPTLWFAASSGTEVVMSHTLQGHAVPKGRTMEPGSRLTIGLGTVELTFATGVRGVVRGPAEMILRRADLLELKEGTAWFEVPRAAAGFQVRTPDLVLTDLGTRFGVVSQRNLPDEVHVFDGRVELLNAHRQTAGELLEAGQARVAELDGRWSETELRRDSFLTALPEREPVLVLKDDSANFTSSPQNEIVSKKRYTFRAKVELSGFDPSRSDKLVVTLSHKRGQIQEVTYGGVRMSLAASHDMPLRQAAIQRSMIYYLDNPGAMGDLVVSFRSSANGVGGSALALSRTAAGGPIATKMAWQPSVTLPVEVAHSFVVAAHTCDSTHEITTVPPTPPLELLFDGPTGSSWGSSGYLRAQAAGEITVGFSGAGKRPVTVAAVFGPIP